MNKKFTLTLIIAIVLVSVIAFSACGLTAVAEDGTAGNDAWAESEAGYPYPSLTKTSPGFSGYTPASEMILADGETLTPITDEMMENPWLVYSTMRENQGKVTGYAQVSNTLSNIRIKLTTDLIAILVPADTDTFDNPIAQYASWMTSQDGKGNNYTQTISQMDHLLPGMDGIVGIFGVWKKSANVNGVNYSQEGDKSSRKFDATAPAGVTASWVGDYKISEDEVTYNFESFDLTKRITANEETENYRVFTGDNDKLKTNVSDFRDSNRNDKNASNWDNEGNRVIVVQYKGSDGSWSDDYWYVWDTQEGNTEGRYVGFDYDRWCTALPSRGDGISNYLVNEETFDNVNSTITKETDEAGNTYYVLDVKLKATDNYSWDLITSGEFGALQGGIIDFLGFSAVDSEFSKDLTLRYEIWDTGVIRRAIKIYTVESVEGAENNHDMQIAITALSKEKPTYAYGSATNNQIQEYAYGGSVVDVAGDAMFGFAKGGLPLFTRIGIGVGVGAAVLIVLIVTLVVLAKKGVIGKKKKNKKAAEGPAEEVVEDNGTDSTENTENKE